MNTDAPLVRALSVHADYRCENSGACCTSGWSIPVELAVEDRLRQALAARSAELVSGATPFSPAGPKPPGVRVVLAHDAAGRCAFLDADTRCAIHRRLGEQQLPAACRQYPRVATLTPLGVSLTLSHYCPTAARRLLDHAGSLRIVENPPAFPGDFPYEGLDARAGWPPLLRPGVLMTWPAFARWEEHAVATFADARLAPEQGIARLAACAERARAWTPDRGDFDAHLASCIAKVQSDGLGDGGSDVDDRDGRHPPLASWRLVVATVPDSLPAPAPPAGLERFPPDGWADLQEPVRKWLASKAFASWLALQGDGLRTSVASLRVALDVLRVEAARACSEAARSLDETLLLQALRRSDLLLVQLADPHALARVLSRSERRRAARAPQE